MLVFFAAMIRSVASGIEETCYHDDVTVDEQKLLEEAVRTLRMTSETLILLIERPQRPRLRVVK